MVVRLASKALDAYQANPILTALLLIIIGLMLGFGYMELKRAEAANQFIMNMVEKEEKLNLKLLDLTQKCAAVAHKM